MTVFDKLLNIGLTISIISMLMSQYFNYYPTECKRFIDSGLNANCEIVSIDDIDKLDKILYNEYSDKCIVLNDLHRERCVDYNIYHMNFKMVYLNVTIYDFKTQTRIEANISNPVYFPYLFGEISSDDYSRISVGTTFSCEYLENTDKVKIESLGICFEHIMGNILESMLAAIILLTVLNIIFRILYLVVILLKKFVVWIISNVT